MILVVGSTGLLGGEICKLLGEQGAKFKALARETSDPAKVEALNGYGAEVVIGDLKDRASLDAACQGVDTVISTASSTLSRGEGDSIQSVNREGQLSLVEAAKAAGVKRYLFTSFAVDPEVMYPLAEAQVVVNAAIKESGMDFTIFECNWFMEVWFSPAVGFDAANATATVYGTGDEPINWISFFDVAKFVTAAVDNDAAHNAVVPIGGPEGVTYHDVVKTFEQAMGKEFEVAHVPEDALRGMMAGAETALQASFPGLMIQVGRGVPMELGETFKTYGVNPMSVSAFVKRALG